MTEFILTTGEYTHVASEKTITIVGHPEIALENVKKIYNITKDELIYDSSEIKYGITMAGAVITYTYDGHGADDDILQIVCNTTRTPVRSAVIQHRAAVSADLLPQGAYEVTSGVTVDGGALGEGVTYFFAVMPSNRYGCGAVSVINSRTPGAGNNAIRIPITQVIDAEYYDIFVSVDAAPKHVLRVTEVERAAGGVCTTVDAYAAGGIPGAIDIAVPGTGIQTSNTFFAANNAYNMDLITATPFDCRGKTWLYLHVDLFVPSLQTVPSYTLQVFYKMAGVNGWYAGPALPPAQTPFFNEYIIPVDGAEGVAIGITSLTGTGASINISGELV